jgi:hypothetical protein
MGCVYEENKRAINNSFIFTFLQEVLKMASMFRHNSDLREKKKPASVRRFWVHYLFHLQIIQFDHSSSLVSTVSAETLVLKYPQKKKSTGLK